MKRLSLLLIALLLPACAFYGPEELDRLMKEDSAFKRMIIQRDQARAGIRAIKDDLLAKKKAMDAQVDKLRREYDLYAKAENQKIEKYERVIDTNRSLVKRDIEAAEASMKTKISELGGYEKTLSDVKKVLKESKGIKLSGEEKQKWQERVMMLTERMRPLSEEIQELKLQTRLKKRKINFLK